LNIQAAYNASMHFIFFSVAAPGKSSDKDALETTSLHSSTSQCPLDFYILGDDVYTVSDQMIPPFTDSSHHHPSKGSCISFRE
jgi:DDE superfamily endonuclease